MKGIKFFYITCPKKKEANKIAAFLVKKKLVACANIINNVDSIFTWKGKVTKLNPCPASRRSREFEFRGSEI